jgi:hypothetical protein
VLDGPPALVSGACFSGAADRGAWLLQRLPVSRGHLRICDIDVTDRSHVWIRIPLGALLAFGALNAFAGGYYGLSGAEGVPREWLAGSPFTDYFVPSLILLVVVGGALAAAAVMAFAQYRLARVGAFAAAAVLLVWIIVQVAIIGYVSWMQPATFTAGVFVLRLAWLLPTSAPRH